MRGLQGLEKDGLQSPLQFSDFEDISLFHGFEFYIYS